jgi:hypothetical protein
MTCITLTVPETGDGGDGGESSRVLRTVGLVGAAVGAMQYARNRK